MLPIYKPTMEEIEIARQFTRQLNFKAKSSIYGYNQDPNDLLNKFTLGTIGEILAIRYMHEQHNYPMINIKTDIRDKAFPFDADLEYKNGVKISVKTNTPGWHSWMFAKGDVANSPATHVILWDQICLGQFEMVYSGKKEKLLPLFKEPIIQKDRLAIYKQDLI